MTDEERLTRRKDFRKYLRTREGVTGTDLDAVIRATEEYVPTLIRERFIPDFLGLFEETIDLSELLRIARCLERDDIILARRQGYVCLRAIKGYAGYYANRNGLRLEDFLPVEDGNDYPIPNYGLDFHEGQEYEVRGIRYERDKDARKQCIDYYKRLNSGVCRCQVCGMSFEEVYGEIGRDFIEVHHIVPISERGGDYVVNPIRDLIPLCSNCHAMIHRGGVSLDELKQCFL